MRRVSQSVTRGVLAGAVVLVLTVPVQAKPREDRPWFERIDPIVKLVKKVVVKTLGDGLIDPRP
jgi:hypothetical protein